MQRNKTLFSKKIMAAFLSFTMIFYLVSPPLIETVTAATQSHLDALTITVVDENSQPIADASITGTLKLISETGVSTDVPVDVKTDSNGEAVIAEAADIADYVPQNGQKCAQLDSFSVSASGFITDTSIDKVVVASTEQDWKVTLKSSTIHATVNPIDVLYDGVGHQAATVSGTQDGDVIQYSLNNGEWQNEMPTITEPGEYDLTVFIKRAGCEDFQQTVRSVIRYAVLNLCVEEYNGDYDGGYHPALKVSGLLPSDKVTYKLNDGAEQSDIPLVKDAGTYSVTMSVERHGYEKYEKTFSNININATEIQGISVLPYSGIYDGTEHQAVSVKGILEGDTVQYQLETGEWSSSVPQIKNAGTYSVKVKISRKNFLDKVIPVSSSIRKAEQPLAFDDANYSDGGQKIVVLDKNVLTKNVYSFSAHGNVTGNPIAYKVESAFGDDSEAAEIDNNGNLTVKAARCLKVTATCSGNDNYNDASITYILAVQAPNENLIRFETEQQSYILGENNGVAASETAVKTYSEDNGTVIYSIDRNDIGLAIDSLTGKLTVSDYGKLGDALTAGGGSAKVTITANKAAGTMPCFSPLPDYEAYPSATVSYTVTVSFLPAPDDAYQLTGTKGSNGWYISQVVVMPKEPSAYTISRSCNAATFGDSVTFSDQGEGTRTVYLRESDTGGITSAIPVTGLKIDTEKPDVKQMNITYSTSVWESFLGAILWWFYEPSVTVTFAAVDTTSGIDHFNWNYTKQSGASSGVLPSRSGSIPVAKVEEGVASAEITLTASEAEQYRGNLSFASTDSAGNTSDILTDDNHVIVVDTVSPTRTVKISSPKNTVGKHLYFDSDATITFSVCEANFFADDVLVQVSKNGGTPYTVTPSWTDGEDDIHTATLTLQAPADHSGDGDYIVTMTYKDRSGNEMEPYTSDTITIDTTKPEIGFSYDAARQTAKIEVTEHNFVPDNISVAVSAKDIEGKSVDAYDVTSYLRSCIWTKQGDVHTATISNWADGIYKLKIDYQDIVGLSAEQAEAPEFTVDHTAPDTLSVTYSKPLLDCVLSTLTFGFYRSPVQVTFTARDATSGVDHFDWTYTRQQGASSVNVERKFGTVKAETKEGVATATVTLPDAEEQIRGSISFTATDQYGNTSKEYSDDGHILVVDTLQPNMKVTYSAPACTVGSRMYYNGVATATLTVNEANFFAQDVKVMVSKNGGKPYAVTPSWTDKSTDDHIGVITLAAPKNHSGDGDYVFTVNYTDRSGNAMASYTSPKITIDTKAPAISISYSGAQVKNTVKDSSGNIRKYYNGTVTAKVTITEHNFDANRVNLSVSAKDVTGKARNSNSLISKSAWSSKGDQHTATVTFSGEANYQLQVSCTDLAQNTIKSAYDSFTVDRTAPDHLKVSYSQSVLDTVLEAVSFGFYNAGVTVTISAADQISGISEFQYSYIKAAGVSPVNGQLLKQTIPSANITYSSDGRYATAKFRIPKAGLGRGTQFNGNVSFTAKDRSGNSTDYKDGKRIVVDNIAPTATVTYNAPVKKENGISYYSGNVTATVTINEANFRAQDVSVSVTKNGTAVSVSPRWTNVNADTHVGTFTLSDDGDYKVSIAYRDRSGNQMATYTSNQLTIDKKIEAPVIAINGSDGNGKAFQGDVIPSVSFSDQNYDGYEIKLTRTSYEKKNEDVTSKFIGNSVSINEHGGSGSFPVFDKVAENDGIYTLTVIVKDKAGHSSTSSCTFTVNRFGSVYAYNDALNDLIANGGAYVKSVKNDLVITEYNATKLLQDSLNIEITCDGNPLSKPVYSVSPEINTSVTPGESGWYQYQYVISKDNFKSDGVYKIVVSSKDSAGNTPENTNYKDKTILFRVDSTPPELTSVTGLNSDIINAQKVKVQYDAYDTIGLKAAEVYLNGKKISEVTDFKEDPNNYRGSFELEENSSTQNIRIVLRDMAGNVTDTDSASFKSAYAFHKAVIISTNAFVRWFADKPRFWGFIGGGAAVIVGAIGLGVHLKRKRAAEQ